MSPLFEEGMIIGLRAVDLSVDLVDGDVSAKAFQLVTMMDSTVTLIADIQEKVVIHHPACDIGEDGIEPAHDEEVVYNFLRTISESEDSFTGTVGMMWGPIEKIDLLSQGVEMRSNEGDRVVNRFAGIQFTLDKAMMGGRLYCYRMVQKPGSDTLQVYQMKDPADFGDFEVIETLLGEQG